MTECSVNALAFLFSFRQSLGPQTTSPPHRRTHLPHPPLPSHLSSEIGGNCFELQDRWITERCLWWTTPECRHQHRFDLLIPLVFLRLRASTARPTPFYPFSPPRSLCHFIFYLLNSLSFYKNQIKFGQISKCSEFSAEKQAQLLLGVLAC